MSPVTRLDVHLRFDARPIPVGTFATDGKSTFFEYLSSFLSEGLQISPFTLPVRGGLQLITDDLFKGIPGVFNDSLPDGWGRLLLHQELRQRGINPAALGPLDELAIVGSSGMGALTYRPSTEHASSAETIDLDRYASASREILEGTSDEMLHALRAAAGASGGARPKVLVSVNTDKSRLSTAEPGPYDQPWLIKFPGSADTADAGAIEYVYALMAKQAGVAMADCHLFPSHQGPGFFGTKRFDREGGTRLHVHSLSGLVHDDHRHPSFDYQQLLAVTQRLTVNHADVRAIFRLAAFNVLAHNRDDHSKNFAFIMGPDGQWSTAPAYDLTYSSGPNGYQSMTVLNEARRPTRDHLKQLGILAGLKATEATAILEQVMDALQEWPRLATVHGVSKSNVRHISGVIAEQYANA